MDKNFVNIDDLVRQRLLGGEEREPAGAWLRMSELLEKDMPVRPVGFGWRRMFGGMAVLLLLSGLGMGGYKMSSFRSLNGTNGTVAGSATVTNSENAPVKSAPGSSNTALNTENNATVASAAVADDNTAHRETTENVAAHKNHKAINSNNNTDNNHNTSNTGSTKVLATNTVKAENADHQLGAHPADKVAIDKNNVRANHNNTTAEVAAADQDKKNTSAAAGRSADKLALNGNTEAGKPDAMKNVVAGNTKTKKGHTAGAMKNDAPAQAGIAKNTNGHAGDKHSPLAAASNNNAVAEKTAEKNADKKAGPDGSVAGKVAKNVNAGSAGKHGLASKDATQTGVKSAETKEIANVGRTKSTTVTGNMHTDKSASPSVTDNASDKKAVAGNTKQHRARAGKHNTTGAMNRSSMVLSSGAPAVKTGEPSGSEEEVGIASASVKPGTSAAAHHTHSKVAGTGNKKAIAGNVTPAKTGKTVAKIGKAVAGKSVTAPAAGGSKAGSKIAIVTPPAQRGKHVIQRLIVNQRLVPCGIHKSILQLDTISIESVTEEYDLAAAKPAASESNGVAKSDQVDDTSPIITSNDRFGSDVKDNNFKSKGAMALEGLNAAFNDIKYKAGHAVFNAGITGGINGTFFGPNSFKGFQFGITGKLSFGEELALMGELKYFNRINNNYSLNDDYYQYTAVSGGYSRELVKNPYSISNLQSIEMPITFQYSKGNFNFILGPNLSYAFGINAGEYPTVVTGSTPTIVAAPGSDNTPKIKANDFDSRFGVGYLLGVSYQVTPKVYLDLRDVQTFWDNSKTTGGKYISSQLYRSPSFQLSIGYRFGGKHKD